MRINDIPNAGLGELKLVQFSYQIKQNALKAISPFTFLNCVINKKSENDQIKSDRKLVKLVKENLKAIKLSTNEIDSLKKDLLGVMIRQARETIAILAELANLKSAEFQKVYKNVQMKVIRKIWEEVSLNQKERMLHTLQSKLKFTLERYLLNDLRANGLDLDALRWMVKAKIIDEALARKAALEAASKVAYS